MLARFGLSVLLLSAASVCWSQDVDDSPAHRFFLIIDADRNGSIEADEWDRFPPLKDYIGLQGVDFSQSMGFDEFAKRQDGFGEALRARFEDAAPGEGHYDSPQGAEPEAAPTAVPQYDSPPVNIAASAGSAPAMRTGKLITTRSPVNHVLPDDYRGYDRNGDGQIGLYEWPRKEIAKFRMTDLNNDGFLTPYEILYGQNKIPGQRPPSTLLASSSPAPTTGSATTTSAPTTGSSSSTSSGSRTSSSGSGASSPSGAALPSDPLVSRATISFKQLDRDNNGAISGDEWRSSRTVRKMFEGASIDITQPMDKDKFIETFVRIVPK